MTLYQALYLAAAFFFIFALKWMSHPSTARRGVFSGELGMLLAIVGTLLNREIVTIISQPDMRERLVTLGYDPVAGTPEEFAQRIKIEIGTWGKVIRAANIKAQ